MNNKPPRFNAPIPEYADLNFLFYRWGYDQLGSNGCKLFENDFNKHIYDEGLTVYNRFPSTWISEKKQCAFMLGKEVTYKDADIELNGKDLIIKGSDGKSLRYVKIKRGFINSGCSTFYMDSLIHEGVTYFPVDTRLIFDSSKELKESLLMKCKRTMERNVSFDYVCLKRIHLQAFEQKTGFFNHGLTLEQVEQYAPTPTDEEKAERQNFKRGEHLNEYVERLSKKQLKLTILAYEEAKEQHPQKRTKTQRLKTAAEIITKKERKPITYKAIEKRLKSIDYNLW